MSVRRGWGLRDPAPLWGDDPLRLSGPTELERETQQESAGAEPPQRHLLLCHQQTCSESWAQTLKVWMYSRVTGSFEITSLWKCSLVSPVTQAVKILSVSLVFMFHFYSLLQPAELVNGVFTCYSEDSFTGVHMWSVTSGPAAIFVNRGQDRSWCQNQFISKRQTKCGICSCKQRKQHSKHIYSSNKTTHRHEDSKLTWGNYSHIYG